MFSRRAAAAFLASMSFGWAIWPNWGAWSYSAISWVFLGAGLSVWLFRDARQPQSVGVRTDLAAIAVWVIALGSLVAQTLHRELILYPANGDWSGVRTAVACSTVVVASYVIGLFRTEARWLRQLRFIVLASTVAITLVTTLRTSPAPLIDVWTVQQTGAEAFAAGKNPFHEVHVGDTGPRTASDVPYVYPPMHLVLSTPAWVLFGDVRYTMALAYVLLGFVVRALAKKHASDGSLPAVLEDAPALVIWCTPMLPFLMEQGWIDPVQVCLVAAMLLAWNRPRVFAVMAGIVISTKQTMIALVLPLGFALGLTWRQWLITFTMAALPYVPWLALDWRAVKHANFDFLNALPARDDALTLTVWMSKRLKLNVPPLVALPLAALVILISARRGRQSLDRAVIASLLVMTAFFVFNKWAFANYYFTLLSLAAMVLATSLRPSEPPPSAPQPY